VTVHHHRDDPPPHEGGEAVEGVFGHRMPEIVGPAALDLVDPGQHGAQHDLGLPVGQGSDLPFQRADRFVRDERVDEPLIRSSFAHPGDVEAEEVEPFPHVHHPGLVLGQA